MLWFSEHSGTDAIAAVMFFHAMGVTGVSEYLKYDEMREVVLFFGWNNHGGKKNET